MATKAGGAYIEIRAEDAHLDRDLNKAQTKDRGCRWKNAGACSNCI